MSDQAPGRVYSPRVVAASAVAGAIFGVALRMVAGGLLQADSAVGMLLLDAAAGSAGGAAVLPAIVAALTRHVPEGRALAWIWGATTLGAVLAFGFLGMTPQFATLGGALGLGMAAWWLRRSARPENAVGGHA